MHGWTIVFDLDGTLVDTAPDLAAATNHVMATLGLAPVDAVEIGRFAGHGAVAMIAAAAKAHGRTLEERELFDLYEVFLVHYTANISAHSRPYPHVLAAIDDLARDGATFAVCTNKIESSARQLLEALGIDGRFKALTGRDSLGCYKPDPRHLTGTIALAGGTPDKAIMVGDSETDVRTAQAAHIPVIAVSFGYSVEPIATFRPDRIIDDFRDLRSAVHDLAGQPVSR